MIVLPGDLPGVKLVRVSDPGHGERGTALAIAILMLGLLSAIALGVLAVVQGDTRIAGSDLRRTEACYASAAAIEKMTNDFSGLRAYIATDYRSVTRYRAQLSYGADKRRLHVSRSHHSAEQRRPGGNGNQSDGYHSVRPVCWPDRQSQTIYVDGNRPICNGAM